MIIYPDVLKLSLKVLEPGVHPGDVVIKPDYLSASVFILPPLVFVEDEIVVKPNFVSACVSVCTPSARVGATTYIPPPVYKCYLVAFLGQGVGICLGFFDVCLGG